MHDTLHPNIKGYIDERVAFKENIFIKGWTFHDSKKVLPVRVKYDNTIVEIEIRSRPDVAHFYNCNNVNLCGWRVKVPLNKFSELQIKLDNNWHKVFLFTPEDNKKYSTNSIKVVESLVPVAPVVPVAPELTTEEFTPKISNNTPSFIVIDNFYEDPDSVREFALTHKFSFHPDYHKGKRTDKVFPFTGLKERFEYIIGSKIKNWEKYGTNCVFQHCVAEDQIVFHFDSQEYAGVLFLTPDAPPTSGTTFYRSKYNKQMKIKNDKEYDTVFKHGHLNSQGFDIVDVVGNVYNRLVLFDSKLIHSASSYFGSTLQDSRLFQLFFFDLEKNV